MRASAHDVAIGIDLGTSFTVVSYHPDAIARPDTQDPFLRPPSFVKTYEGGFLFPSMVTFSAEPPNLAAVGEVSKNLASVLPERTVYQAKLLQVRGEGACRSTKLIDSVWSENKYLLYQVAV
jgi:molecular chaperone DnaK (HSP70)